MASENQMIGNIDSRSGSAPKLMKRLRLALRSRHYSSKTEQAYYLWVKRFICSHKIRQLAEMAEPDMNARLVSCPLRSRFALVVLALSLGFAPVLRAQMQELEQARQLQLSMLPERTPEHPTVEITAYMKTATEVGGDYYDFDLSDDGTLTIIIGDATGHGVSAGTMVTATKGILNVLSGEEDLEQVLTTASEAVRRMHLPKLYMALALVRLRDHTLELAGAGMPPALVYRAASGCVEAVALNGMPLGSPGVYPYRRQCMHLSAGDTVVLMSDGFPELSGASGQRLGYDRMPELVAEAATRSPEQVIEYLMETAKAWCNGQVGPDDDMTFVVWKVKV